VDGRDKPGRDEVMRGEVAAELDRDTIEKAYARWAPVYDLVFGAVFERGRMAAIAAAEQACPAGGRILEVGVGTGISLPDYDRSHRLVGIVGHHEVIFGLPHQTARLTHESSRREAFCTGAAFALSQRAACGFGFYAFDDFLLRSMRNELPGG
jgi:phosphatidylethanolamine/phosphatidyl-N-methylethanolamine N-methyltransferase